MSLVSEGAYVRGTNCLLVKEPLVTSGRILRFHVSLLINAVGQVDDKSLMLSANLLSAQANHICYLIYSKIWHILNFTPWLTFKAWGINMNRPALAIGTTRFLVRRWLSGLSGLEEGPRPCILSHCLTH